MPKKVSWGTVKKKPLPNKKRGSQPPYVDIAVECCFAITTITHGGHAAARDVQLPLLVRQVVRTHHGRAQFAREPRCTRVQCARNGVAAGTGTDRCALPRGVSRGTVATILRVHSLGQSLPVVAPSISHDSGRWLANSAFEMSVQKISIQK